MWLDKQILDFFQKKVKRNSIRFKIIKKNFNIIQTIKLEFESKYDVLDNDVPDKLYHLSIKEYENKILNTGLIVKNKSKLSIHTHRIYLCKNIDDCKKLLPSMFIYYSREKYDNIYTKNKPLYKKKHHICIVWNK